MVTRGRILYFRFACLLRRSRCRADQGRFVRVRCILRNANNTWITYNLNTNYVHNGVRQNLNHPHARVLQDTTYLYGQRLFEIIQRQYERTF